METIESTTASSKLLRKYPNMTMLKGMDEGLVRYSPLRNSLWQEVAEKDPNPNAEIDPRASSPFGSDSSTLVSAGDIEGRLRKTRESDDSLALKNGPST